MGIRKNVKKLGLLLGLCIFFFSGCRQKNDNYVINEIAEKNEVDKAQEADEDPKVNEAQETKEKFPVEYVILEEIKEEGSNLDSVYQESVLLEYDFQMPQVGRISGQAAEKIGKWQAEELEIFRKELEMRTLEADSDCQERKLDPDEEKRGWGVPCIYSVNYSVFQDADMTSFLKVEYQYYSGGAHGTTSHFGTVFDSNTGERMILDDFLGEEEGGREKLAQYLIDQLYGESLWDDYQEVIMDKLTNNPEFYVEEDSLVFLFDQYELASYANGPFFLKVPLREFSGR